MKMKPSSASLVAILVLLVAVVPSRAAWPFRGIDKDAERKVKFELYTRDNDGQPEVVTVSELPERLQFFSAARPTKILVHGWHGSQVHTALLKKAFLAASDVNVFITNWRGVDTLYYPGAVKRVTLVAHQLAALVDFLTDAHLMDPQDLHIIGHSLGAHISGMSTLYRRGTGTIGRITGLDPAGPLFKNSRGKRLDKSQADFVDVVHTCANVFGYHDPVGHVDFYPNGGLCFQPGCLVKDLTTGKCSHNRAYYLFLESIVLDKTLMAVPGSVAGDGEEVHSPCVELDIDAEMVPMGLATPTSARGVYCLSTKGEAPFGYGREVPIIVASEPNSLQERVMRYVFFKLTS